MAKTRAPNRNLVPIRTSSARALPLIEKGHQQRFKPPMFYTRQAGQRVKDHGARRREAEWQAYQATWQKPINELQCDAGRFFNLRRYVLNLNRKQTARLLRVSVNSVLYWERGRYPVPFYAYLALLLISESLHYRFANQAWKDWELVMRFDADGRKPSKDRRYVVELVNRRIGACFLPEELENIHMAQTAGVGEVPASPVPNRSPRF